MFIYNGFSKTPTRNFQAAGIDFFIPDIDDNNQEQLTIAREALKKSYKITDEDIELFFTTLDKYMSSEEEQSLINGNRYNILHLFYGLKSYKIYKHTHIKDSPLVEIDDYAHRNIYNEVVRYFVEKYLVFSKDRKPGIACQFSDMLFLNSGIKVALNPYTCLEFKNKSGKGVGGWSVKACLVDEDYSGYMHLSMQYLWYDYYGTGTVYVGDKLTQGVVYKPETDDAIELTKEEYDERMKNSKRGSDGFGSSDVQH